MAQFRLLDQPPCRVEREKEERGQFYAPIPPHQSLSGSRKRAVSPDMFLTSISGYLNTRPNSSFIMQGIYVLSYIVVTGSVVSARKISRLYRDSNLTIEIEFQLRLLL